MSRRDARDVAFKLIFSYTFDQMRNPEALEEYTVQMVADDKAYVIEVYNGVIDKYEELIRDVSSNAKNFEINRIFKVDLAVLLLAIYEIKYINDIPFKVSVDEAITLAKKYSTEKSGKYINGVLSKFAR